MSTRNKKLTITLIAIVAFIATIAGGYLLRTMQNGDEETPNPSIEKVESEDSDKNNDADVSLKYAGYVTLTNDEKIITLNFTNPSKSKKSLNLDIIANIDGEDIILAKTDKIQPGYKINNVKYDLDKEIPKGNYKGKFIVHFYNAQDIEEIVSSEIAINVYVK